MKIYIVLVYLMRFFLKKIYMLGMTIMLKFFFWH